jgi:tetratricopeptide (TPR) repeat protein
MNHPSKKPSFVSAAARQADRIFIICLILATATIAVYWPVVTFNFVNFDDPDYVTSNSHVLGGLTWRGVVWAFHSTFADNWHPLTWLSHMLDVELFGASAGAAHFVNLVLHTVNVLLLFLVLRRLSGGIWRSAFVAALFALHPLHIESVAWISERKDVLSSFFGLLALRSYVLHAKKSQTVPAFTPSRSYWAALFFFALALMSKPMLVTLPFLLLLLDIWPLRRFESSAGLNLIREKAPFLIFSAFSCLITMAAQNRGGATQALTTFPFTVRIETVFVAFVEYLEKTFWPTNLCCLYLHSGHWPLVTVLLSGFIIIGFSLLAVCFWRRLPFVFVGWFWFLGMLVPVIGLVQVGWQFMADRYTYLPLVGIFLILVWGAGEIVRRWRVTAVPFCFLGIVVLITCALITKAQLRYWQNSETLFRRAIAVNGNNDIAYNNLGYYLFQCGRLDEAMENYRRALQINPAFKKCRYNLDDLGNFFSKNGECSLAVECFDTALLSNTNFFDAHYGLANALLKCGRTDEAIEHYQRAAQLKPDDGATFNNLGLALVMKGRSEEAVTNFHQAIRLKPDFAEALCNLGGVFMVQKRYDEAIVSYEAALRVEANRPEIHYSLAQAFFFMGRWEDAALQFKDVLSLSPDNPKVHLELGEVLARLGKPTEAAAEFREALRLKSDFPEAERALNELEPSLPK